MSIYRSGFAEQVEKFVAFRKASGRWNEYVSAENLKYFDRYCADHYDNDSELTQEMADAWCQKRETESNNSCIIRTLIVREFIKFLRLRGLTDIVVPKVPRPDPTTYVPHAFTDEELAAFFNACDNIVLDEKSSRIQVIRKLQCPVFFRLLYSSGIRTTEARYLKRRDVDLVHGVLNIQKSKGYDQHYVAVHQSLCDLLRVYDAEIDKLQPDRTYFFESAKSGSFYTRAWVECNFKELWITANGNTDHVVPYDLRHNYAIQNIMSWEDDNFEIDKKLHYLSKSMGHKSFSSTLYYYSIVPKLADKIKKKTEVGFNEIVPEVWNEEM